MKLIKFLIFILTLNTYSYSQLEMPEPATFDMSDTHQKGRMDKFWLDRITKSEMYMAGIGIFDLWDKIARYIEGMQEPIPTWKDAYPGGLPVGAFIPGMQTMLSKYRGKMFNVNAFQVHKDQYGYIFFADNKIGDNEKQVLGEFTGVKKVLTARHSANPRRYGLEQAATNYINQYEEQRNLYDQITVPCIRNMLRYNIGYERCRYNPFSNIARMGDIDIDYFYPWHVLIDPTSIKRFLLDSRYRIPFKPMPLSEARVFLQTFGIKPEKVRPDTDSATMLGRKSYINYHYYQDEPMVTIYFPEYRVLSLAGREALEVNEQGNLTKGEVQETVHQYYDMVFTKQLGTVYHRPNKYANPLLLDQDQFPTYPYLNKHSDISILCAGPLGEQLVYQDILNVVLSMKINNSRQRSLLRALMPESVYNKWEKKLVDQWASTGGIQKVDDAMIRDIGGLDKVIHFAELPASDNEALNEILPHITQAFDRAGIKNDILAGRLPTKTSERMSGKLAREIKQANATVLEPTVHAIQWAGKRRAARMYAIMAQEFTEDNWAEINDAKRTDPKRIPIRANWTTKEYVEYLKEAYPNLDPAEADKKFQEHNDVQKPELENTDERGTIRHENDIAQNQKIFHINHFIDDKE